MATLDNARAYLAKMPAAVSGQHGHDALFKAALVLVRGFALSEADALELLHVDYSPRCDPPWNERELAHKVRDAATSNTPAGYLLEGRRRGKQTRVQATTTARDWRAAASAGGAPGLPRTITEWPRRWREAYEERAALLEYDGGLPRDAAEHQAEDFMRELFAREG